MNAAHTSPVRGTSPALIPVYPDMSIRRFLPVLSLILLLAAACDRPPDESPPSPEAPPKAKLDGDGTAGTGVRLALLEPSNDMFLASLEGVLHAEGRCLYVVGTDRKRSRTLPAFHIADMIWDSGTRTLKANGRVFAQGERVLLTGGSPPTTAGFRWVQRPDPSCDSSDIFVTGAIEPARDRQR